MKKFAVAAIALVLCSLALPVTRAEATSAGDLLSRISALEVATRADKAAAAINRKDLADSLINTLTKAQPKAASGDASGAQSLLNSFTTTVQANYGTRVYFKAADKLLGLADGSIAPDVTTITPGKAATVSASAGGGTLAVSIPSGTNIGIVEIDPPAVPQQVTPPVAQQMLGAAVLRAYDKNGVPVTVPNSPLTLTFTVTGGQWTVSNRAELDTVDPKTLKTQRLASTTTSGSPGSFTVTAQTKHLSPFTVNAPSSSGVITNFAGGAGEGQAMDLDQIPGRVVARGGTLYVSDYDRGVIRAVDLASGRETVFAGSPGRWDASNLGEGVPATSGGILRPEGLAFDAAGELFVADEGSGTVRRIDTTGTISTVAHDLNRPMDVAVDSLDQLWIADTDHGTLLTGPIGGPYSPVVSVPQAPRALAADGSGHVYVATNPSLYDYTLRIYDVDVVHHTTTMLLEEPSTEYLLSLALDHAGHLLVGRYFAATVQRIDLVTNAASNFAGTGDQGFAGDGHLATTAKLWGPLGLTVDDLGSVYIGDSGNQRVRRVDFAGVISTVAGTGQNRSYGGDGDGGAAASAQFSMPQRAAADRFGNVYVTDYSDAGYGRVRKVDVNGTITSLASNLDFLGAIAVDASGNVFVGESTDEPTGRILKIRPDGAKSTFVSDVVDAQGMAFDSAGNLLVADNYTMRVLRISPSGAETVVSADPSFDGFGNLAVDAAGNIYVAGWASARVWKIATDGTVTVAVHSPDVAQPFSLAIAPDGRLLVGDLQRPVVIAVDADGNVATLVGNGAFGNSGNGGPALDARISDAYGLAYDGIGNLYVVDSTAGCVRRVEA